MRRGAFLLAMAVLQEPKYDLRKEWTAREGQRATFRSEQVQKRKFVLRGGEETVSESVEDSREVLEGTREILQAKDGRPLLSRLFFTRATRTEGGVEVPFPFQGKAVLQSTESGATFRYEDGSELPGGDARTIGDALRGAARGSKGDPADLFAPKDPVAVGEIWKVDLEALAKDLWGEHLGVDLKKSRAEFALVSVETRNGAGFGKTRGTVEVWVTAFGPLKLAEPLGLILQVRGEVCLDGSRPDRIQVLTSRMKGEVAAKLETSSRQMTLLVDVDSSTSLTVQSAD